MKKQFGIDGILVAAIFGMASTMAVIQFNKWNISETDVLVITSPTSKNLDGRKITRGELKAILEKAFDEPMDPAEFRRRYGLKIGPTPYLTPEQQAAIAEDYDSKSGGDTTNLVLPSGGLRVEPQMRLEQGENCLVSDGTKWVPCGLPRRDESISGSGTVIQDLPAGKLKPKTMEVK